MKIGPFLAVIFAFFLIAIFPYYAGNDEPSYVISDEDGDGITDDKDKCPREAAAEGQDIDEDGCTDNALTKEEISYLGKIAKFNLAQHLLFSIIAIVSGAIYWEREKIRNILYEEDKFLSEFKKASGDDKASENVDYEDLGEDKVYNEQTGSIFDGFKFSFSDFNAEADRGIQIISLICLVCFLIGPNQTWLEVEGERTQENEGVLDPSTNEDFSVLLFSDYLEFTSNPESETEEAVVNSDYENPNCTEQAMEIYNCNYRSSLFGTMEQLLTLSALFCFIVFILNFRAEKYRKGIAIAFTLCLVTTMTSLLLFTTLIDNALESDEILLEEGPENVSGCWMKEPIIWGETECHVNSFQSNEGYVGYATYAPGLSFWIILTTVSILFIGLFTSINPLLTMEKVSWTETLRLNWQIFAMIFAIFFLWRLNTLLTNL